MKTTNPNYTTSPRSKRRGFIRLGMLCLLGSLMAPIQSYAGILAGFVEAKPTIRTTRVKNGALVKYSGTLRSGLNPVSGIVLEIRIKKPGDGKDGTFVARVTTKSDGRFTTEKKIILSPKQLKLGQASIPWLVKVIKAPNGVLIKNTNSYFTSGWGFLVYP